MHNLKNKKTNWWTVIGLLILATVVMLDNVVEAEEVAEENTRATYYCNSDLVVMEFNLVGMDVPKIDDKGWLYSCAVV